MITNSRFDINKDEIIREAFKEKGNGGQAYMITMKELYCIINKTIEHILSYDNIARIILTYKSFSDRSCPGTLIKQTVEKLKADNL